MPVSFARAVLGLVHLAVVVMRAPGVVVIAREASGTARSLNVSSRAITAPLVSSATMVGVVVDSISVVALAAGVKISPVPSEIMAATTPVARVCLAFSLRDFDIHVFCHHYTPKLKSSGMSLRRNEHLCGSDLFVGQITGL